MPIIVYVRVHINIRIEYTSCFVKKTVFEHIILICFLLQVMSSGGSALNPLEELEQNLERSIENVRQIRIVVSDFQPQGQPGLNQKLQQIVKDLQEIDKLRPKVQDIQVIVDMKLVLITSKCRPCGDKPI